MTILPGRPETAMGRRRLRRAPFAWLLCAYVRRDDKLTEIMAWKRRELASRLRPVSEAELARMAAGAARRRRPSPRRCAGETAAWR